MKKPRLWLAASAAAALVLTACGEAVKAVDETVGRPLRAAGEGVRQVGKEVGRIGKVGEGVVGPLLTDRNRFALLREHRDLREHLKKVEDLMKRRETPLAQEERRILQDARDSLAAVGRQLEGRRIPVALGARIHRQLDGVRQTFGLFHGRHNTPPYTGFVADR